MKIIMNSIGSPFTLDMYQTFTTDSVEEYMLECYNEENNTDLCHDDFNWNYNMDSIHKKLADIWKDFILDNFQDIITDIRVLSIHRPKYYNYTTDSANFSITYNARKVNAFIKQHAKEYAKYTEPREFNMHYSECPESDNLEKLYFYMNAIAERDNLTDDYIMYAYEEVHETMYNSISFEL